MKIVADDNIPYLQDYFSHLGELIVKPGRDISRNDLVDADVLLVRSITQVNAELLAETSVKFVGSATTGADHLDTEWLEQVGIAWYVAEGCNATAVVEYVIAVIACLQKMAVFPERKWRAAVIGVGRIGQRVSAWLRAVGFDVIQCDPLRAASDPLFESVALEQIANVDLITLHVPLTESGLHPTHHLITKKFLLRQQKGCVLLNTSRGAVIDFSDVEEYGQHLYWCFDVWEHEPVVNFEMLSLTTIATPHIAGYSLQSKQRGVDQVYRALCAAVNMTPQTPAPLLQPVTLSFNHKPVDWRDVVLRVYDPEQTTDIMKVRLIENGSGAAFDALRRHFPPRYEFAAVTVQEAVLTPDDQQQLLTLGFTVS